MTKLVAVFSLHKRTLIALLFGLAFSAAIAYATPPGSPYAAGATLDPGCVPGSTNCTVTIFPDQTGNSGKYLTTDGSSVSWVDAPDALIGSTSKLGTETWLGENAGSGGASHLNTVMIGINAGEGATAATNAIIIGESAGQGATNAVHSIFLGADAGTGATDADHSNFIGYHAGKDADNATNANFLGLNAGEGATDAVGSNFLGPFAGNGATNATLSNFLGDSAGLNATNAYFSNFFGEGAGAASSYATRSFFVGPGAGENVGTDSSYDGNSTGFYFDSNFIGNQAGRNSTYAEHSNFFGQNAGSDAAQASYSNFFGVEAGNAATDATNSNFIGWQAGKNATEAFNSNFIGQDAGLNATNANGSNFFGQNAGDGATNATLSNFIGRSAGQNATGADDSNFFGSFAGQSATDARFSNFIGYIAGADAPNAAFSTFIGQYAGYQSTNGSYSVFIGDQAGKGATNAKNSIFIGERAGLSDLVDNTAAFNDSSTFADTSILIGRRTSTFGFKNSIALGAYATNTGSNQFMVGSPQRRIDNLVFNGGTGNTCSVSASTGITCSSDERLKTNITDIQSALDDVMNLRTVTYNWKSDPNGAPMIGFIAQNLINYFPQVVSQNVDGMYSVNYAQMTPVLARAIQELNIKVENMAALSTDNDATFVSKLSAWLANAENHITRIFTGEICLTDEDGSSECLNKAELGQLKHLLDTGTVSPDTPQQQTPDTSQDIVPPIDDIVDDSIPAATDTPDTPSIEVAPQDDTETTQ